MSNERITDEQLEEALGSPNYHNGFGRAPDMWTFKQIKRAILTLRPAAQPEPLTSEEQSALKKALFKSARVVERATPAAEVRMPTTEDEAAAMQMLGQAWLEQHAPHRLKAAQPAGEPAASIYISPSGQREFDDWKCDFPAGRNILYTTAQPAPERVPVAISDHEKDCATCAHQNLPPYMPKCQQCNRLATGARRNWQAQPVFERVPMSRKDLKAFMDESGYGHVTAQEKADFINGFRSAEAHHRITTPSNQPARTE